MRSGQEPKPQCSDPQVGGISEMQRFSLKSKGFKDSMPWGSTPGRRAPIMSVFENHQDLTVEKLECYRNLKLHS